MNKNFFKDEKMTRYEKLTYFKSKHFLKMIEKVVRNHCRNSKVKIVSSSTTCTDGKTLFINFDSEVFLKEEYGKLVTTYAFLADAFHENGHLEETCFEIRWAINSDTWDSSFLTTEEKRVIEKEVSRYVKKLNSYERHALADMHNIIEDAAMERLQGIKYGSFVQKCFKISNTLIGVHRPSLNELQEKNISEYKLLVEAILSYSIIHCVKGTFNDETLQNLFEKTLMPLCVKGMYAETPMGRFKVTTEIFDEILPYLKKLEKETKSPYENQSKSNATSNGNSSGSSQSQDQQQSDDAQNSPSESNGENNRKIPNLSEDEKELSLEDIRNLLSQEASETSGNSKNEDGSPKKENLDDILNNLVEDVDEESFDEEIIKELNKLNTVVDKERAEKMKAIEDEIKFADMSKFHPTNTLVNIPVKIKSQVAPFQDANSYNEIVREYSSLIATFIAYFENVLKPENGRTTYTQFGKNISNKRIASYRFNPNIFTTRVKENTKADFSICLVIDASGSMSRGCAGSNVSKIYMARVTAIVLNEVFSALNIPFTVLTHAASSPVLSMRCFKTFNSTDEDKYRLATIDNEQSVNGSRDGYALRFIGKYLEDKADNCIILSITDGAPNDRGYSGDAARNDTKKAIQDLSARNKVVGVSIANDNGENENIRSMYENMIVVDDLKTLPASLLDIIA